MANVVPLAVSGQIGIAQRTIILTIINSSPYYLVQDLGGVPYFQPLFQDVSTGLETFSQYAARVTVTIGGKSGLQATLQIVSLSDSHPGDFLVNPTIQRIVAPGTFPNGNTLIPIEKLSYSTPALIACGYEYVIDQGIGFYVTNNWSANPNAQSINLIALTTPATGLFVYPVDGLYDTTGKPTSTTVFSAIYNDVLGKNPEVFLFTSQNAYAIGGGQPYYFCPDSSCGPLCYGLCHGKFEGCLKLVNGDFGCAVTASPTCKVLALLPFMIPAVLCIIAFWILFFVNKYSHIDPKTGKIVPGKHVYVTSRNTKIALAILMAIPAILLIIMLLLATVDTGGSSWYLRQVCAITGDYK